MPYIIESCTENLEGKAKDLYIKNGQVNYVGEQVKRLKGYRLSIDDFFIQPGGVLLYDEGVNQGLALASYENILKIGATTVVIPVHVRYERQVTEAISRARKWMTNCPSDYLFAVVVPISKLKERLVRRLYQEKIPLIMIELDDEQALREVKWQRISEALFPLKSALMLRKPSKQMDPRQEKYVNQTWSKVVKQYQFNAIEELPNGSFFSKQALKQLGLYPKKGVLQTGSDADYVLIQKDMTKQDCKEQDASVVVRRGEVLKAGEVFSCRSEGEEITNIMPGKFLPFSNIFRS
ncbi:hypothetical protein [Texcoconibacillus texcoconensis]|uniref:Amidohydrolase-related domain-containing protein n=1 Tax=Texcoconibacillus texcoconensis TaxID=1095777 RepID=A0A840QNE5_9BACI|nr:hypothetical protein [Texcoconibacillus texcoconensis]MBB5172877.1 hypothetical protein [Texcoconibacillus texcoconensis]